MPSFLTRLTGFAYFVWRRFNQDRCLQIAGSLTYTTILSLVPMFTILVAVMSAMPFFEKVMVDIKIFLLLNLVPDIAYKIITIYMEQFADNAGRMTAVGLLALLITALALLFSIDRSVNLIWRARAERPWWLSVLSYLLLLVVAPLLLGAGLSASSFLISISGGVTQRVPHGDVALFKLLAVAGSTTAFFLVFRLVPCRHVPWRHALIGGLTAALLFESMKQLFTWYIASVPTYDMVYGAFAAIPIFLLWVYLSWGVLLIGAEVAAALAYWHSQAWASGHDAANRLADGLGVLRALSAAQAVGGSALDLSKLARTTAIPLDRIEDTLESLRAAELIERAPRGAWRLAVPANELLLADTYRLFVAPWREPAGGSQTGQEPMMAEIDRALQVALDRRLTDLFQPAPTVAQTGEPTKG